MWRITSQIRNLHRKDTFILIWIVVRYWSFIAFLIWCGPRNSDIIKGFVPPVERQLFFPHWDFKTDWHLLDCFKPIAVHVHLIDHVDIMTFKHLTLLRLLFYVFYFLLLALCIFLAVFFHCLWNLFLPSLIHEKRLPFDSRFSWV